MSDPGSGRRVVSLAAGTMLDVGPAAGVDVAADSGFDAVGLWHDADLWTRATTLAVAARLRATGLRALDLEPVIFGRGDDHGERMVGIAAELNVNFLLVASGAAPRGAVADRLAALAAQAASEAPHLTLVLEFLPIFSVSSLADAVALVGELACPNVGVLVDSLHLARSGSVPADLQAVPSALLPYLQLADAGAIAPTTKDELRDEALHGRLLPGAGVLPLAELLHRVPAVPVSIELRSRALMERFADPVDRARAVKASLSRVGLG